MLAVDTNVLVRYLLRDDADQAARAVELISHNEVWIPKSVLLETEWVLRRVYGFSPGNILDSFQKLAGIPTVFFEDELTVSLAMDWAKQGLDFADALHLASARNADGFSTFDRELAKRAKPLSPIRVRTL
ncbi:MAG: type II toxin-antitoxin system VapC family toxin [Terriglobia bacterium]|jgi:predicted nucleic-acid-binding protein